MVLLDDNFRRSVTAVREGRRVFDNNIRKFIKLHHDPVTPVKSGIAAVGTFQGLPRRCCRFMAFVGQSLFTDGLPLAPDVFNPPHAGIMN